MKSNKLFALIMIFVFMFSPVLSAVQVVSAQEATDDVNETASEVDVDIEETDPEEDEVKDEAKKEEVSNDDPAKTDDQNDAADDTVDGELNNNALMSTEDVMDTTAPEAPEHISKANNSVMTSAEADKLDWTTVTDASEPVTYKYESSTSNAVDGNGAFTSPIYGPVTLADSEIPTAGTPEGIYYWHVKAVDAAGNESAWTNPWKITIDNTPDEPVTTGDIKITKYACPEGTTVVRSANGVGGTVPEGCELQSGATFGYVHGDQTDANAPHPELDEPVIAGGATGEDGVLVINDLTSEGRYLIVETNESNEKLAAEDVLGLYCTGDGDTSDQNDNQEITFVPAGGTTNCVAYNQATEVIPGPDTTAPVVSIGTGNGNSPENTGPEHNSTVSGIVPVYATVQDANLTGYHFRIVTEAGNQGHSCGDSLGSPANQGFNGCGYAYNLVVSTTTSVTNGMIASIDTTELPNGVYQFILGAVDEAGNRTDSNYLNDPKVFVTVNNQPLPETVTVTIVKYADGDEATAEATDGASFPMTSSWSATNIGSGTGTYTLNPNGYNSNSTPYHAVTAEMTSGADYSTYENIDGICTEGEDYRLAGYSTGDSLAQAESAATTSEVSFTNIVQDKYVIVWNESCDDENNPVDPEEPTPTDATVIVTPSNMQGWAFATESGTATGTLVVGPGTVPLGTGSAQFTTTVSADGELLYSPIFMGTQLSDIEQLKYSTYRASGSEALAVALQFNIDVDSEDALTGWQGRLVYEPYHTKVVQDDMWQTWDTMDDAEGGNWWFSGAPGNVTCPMANPCTWSEVKAAFPNAQIHPTLGAINFKAGSGWEGGFVGNVDELVITVDDDTTTFDFEHEAVPVDENPDNVTNTDDDDDNSSRGRSGGRRSTGSSGSVLGVSFNDQGEVLGASMCAASINSYMRMGIANNAEEVRKLQIFLNDELDTTLDVNGIYDMATVNAVNAFQLKYADKILAPWGITAPTGYAYILTTWWANALICGNEATAVQPPIR